MSRLMATLALVLLSVGACSSGDNHRAGHVQPIALPPVAAAPGADTAWLTSGNAVVGVAPDGRNLGVFTKAIMNGANGSGALRSADGERLYLMSGSDLKEISAADGHQLRTVRLPPAWRGSAWAIGAVSADGRWVGLAGPGRLALIDLTAGAQVATTRIESEFASTLLVTPSGRVLIRPSDSALAEMIPHGDTLQEGAISAAPEMRCAAPPVLRLLHDWSTLVGFCPMDGAVWWFDISQFKVLSQLKVPVGNPFWGAPTFSADGRSLVVFDSWGGNISVIDLLAHRVVRTARPIHIPATAIRLPFVTDAYAKGPNYSAALAPDDLTLFVVATRSAGGIYAVDTTTMAVRARWQESQTFDGVWAGGDARTIYAIEHGGNALLVFNLQSGAAKVIRVSLVNGFTVA